MYVIFENKCNMQLKNHFIIILINKIFNLIKKFINFIDDIRF